ncbi:zinc-ribbon domain-containing protein [Aphanizomenon flos-aquae]|uniref:zinc-ribbon domain-containing protein n=1 Tax=Aphanizomenon flos-aquae TaxID=1176 RepID=UPI0004B07EAE|nr:zinc ribbon domain-containing protein [Aphanizomenon flos-aquae]
MTLLKCSECNKEISSKAATCPNCGAPMKRKSGCLAQFSFILFWVSVVLFIVFLIGLISPNTPTPPQTSETETPPSQNKEIETQEQKAKAEEKKVEQQREAEQRKIELNTKIEQFKQWALNNTAVTDIAIDGGITMNVTLTPDKYTNRDNVRVIAETLAMAYANKFGLDLAICHVYYGNEEYAKGIFNR